MVLAGLVSIREVHHSISFLSDMNSHISLVVMLGVALHQVRSGGGVGIIHWRILRPRPRDGLRGLVWSCTYLTRDIHGMYK